MGPLGEEFIEVAQGEADIGEDGEVADNVLSAYIAALEKEAGVTVNEAAWQNISGQQTN